MTLARLFAVMLFLWSLAAFAQDQKSSKLPASGRPASGDVGLIHEIDRHALDINLAATATRLEPWRIIPNWPGDIGSGQNRLDRIPDEQFKVDPQMHRFKLDGPSLTFLPGLDGQFDADTTCYAIRNYVVARDAKDSDSTHPAGYSTCQPAARYQLKTTEIRSGSKER